MQKTVTIIGINGHIGRAAARAFVAAGWTVKGMGRANCRPLAGVEFVQGDADRVADMEWAIDGSEVVFNGLNLPYHEWDNGRMEAQTGRVIAAVRGKGKTLLYPGNIYNYAADLEDVAPEAPQNPETPRGAIRVRCEAMLRKAAERGEAQVVILRAGDFFGPGNSGDWHDQVIMREAHKGRIAQLSAPDLGHAWAYLPDLGRAFVRLAEVRETLGAFETFHFEGHYVTAGEMTDAILKTAPVPLRVVPAPLTLFRVVGLFSPTIREVMKMRYLWENPMRLTDPRLAAILGPDFGTPFEAAMGETVRPFFSVAERTAA